ncbi:MAG: methyltransferase domain-containing protein [Planctomycetaceae bacterium]|nr:methyltransferase domain-containing protein [Planctomycetaceae bacterium]
MSSFDLHQLLLADRVRLRAVRDAFRKTVRPGAVIVDLGSGTGILGYLALRAGAGRVYAIERHPIVKLARSLAAENGFQDRVTFVKGDSRRVTLPERADLVISDLVGPFGVDPEMAESIVDARRFLKKGGRFVPERSELWMAPVSAPALHRRHVLPGKGCGIRLDAVHAIAANRMGVFRGAPRGLAAPLRRCFVFDFARDAERFPRRAAARVRVKGGLLHGLAVVVKVRLFPGVAMDSRYGCHWQPMFLPVRRPIATRAGERVPVELTLHDLSNIEWRVGDQRQSTLLERAAYE